MSYENENYPWSTLTSGVTHPFLPKVAALLWLSASSFFVCNISLQPICTFKVTQELFHEGSINDSASCPAVLGSHPDHQKVTHFQQLIDKNQLIATENVFLPQIFKFVPSSNCIIKYPLAKFVFKSIGYSVTLWTLKCNDPLFSFDSDF